jgi:hypothetical protein
VTERSFSKLDALYDGATHTIHSGDDVINVDPRATSRPDMALGQVVYGELVDLMDDGAGKAQIGSGTLRAFCLG